jgi:hypothetical protein
MRIRTKLFHITVAIIVATLPAKILAQQGSVVKSVMNLCAGEEVTLTPVCPGSSTGNYLNFAPNGAGDFTEVFPAPANGARKVIWLHSGKFEITAYFDNCSNSGMIYYLQVGPALVGLPSATQTLNFCNLEEVVLTIPGYDQPLHWYTSANAPLGTGTYKKIGKLEPGTYTYKARIWNPWSCNVPGGLTAETTVTVNVTTACDEKLNRTETIAFGEIDEVSHSVSYFDITGEPLQSQTKSYATNAVFTSEVIKDKYERPVVSTLPVPLQGATFTYREMLVKNQAGTKYNYQNIGEAFDQTTPGTVGWYYSEQNNLEENVPVTAHPYSRITFYNDGTTEQKLTGSVGEVLGIGSGHETVSGSFPVFSELDDYLTKRSIALPGVVHDNNLRNEGVVNIGRDQNGKYAISVADREGKTVWTALPGTSSDHVFVVNNEIESSGNPDSANFRQSTYIYLLHDQPVTISGSTDFVVENIVTEERKPAGQTFAGAGGNWPAGFYRIILDNTASEVTIEYLNYFKDVAYQFYDDAGRLKKSVSPNGMVQWKQGTTFDLIDKTDYTYNFRGWLMETKEPDAGISKFQYRKDGQIRFSQNAQQATTSRFSYTSYDQLGRPVESGEYIGTQKTFASVAAELEYATQISYLDADKTDWIQTKYDVADDEFSNAWTSSPYKQTFLRGAVSFSQNKHSKTWYSYDEFGRATWIARKPTKLNLVFVTTYQYDFLGNALSVSNFTYDWTTHALVNQFHHHYEYDTDQRLNKAYTSQEANGTKKLRATYFYYLHGPLKRIELGDKLQGVDFVYNIHGWLTQINHPQKSKDPGNDANDAFGMVLDYYESDIPNLLSGKIMPHSPVQLHGLPEMMLANQSYKQALPRFAPEAPDAGLLQQKSMLKKYSAENPVYQQMMSSSTDTSTEN